MIGYDALKSKIFLLIGRAILTAVNNDSTTVQKLRLTLLSGEVASDVERLQEYGLETYPLSASSEALVLFLNGNRNHGVAITVHDRSNRPSDLSSGDVKLYDYRGNFIHLSSDGIRIEDSRGNFVETTSTGVSIEDLNGVTIKTNNSKVELNGSDDNAVSWTDLNTALQTLVSSINTALGTKQDFVGTPGALSLDLSSAKIASIKVP